MCAYARPRYHVSVYRTIGPLILIEWLLLYVLFKSVKFPFRKYGD